MPILVINGQRRFFQWAALSKPCNDGSARFSHRNDSAPSVVVSLHASELRDA